MRRHLASKRQSIVWRRISPHAAVAVANRLHIRHRDDHACSWLQKKPTCIYALLAYTTLTGPDSPTTFVATWPAAKHLPFAAGTPLRHVR